MSLRFETPEAFWATIGIAILVVLMWRGRRFPGTFSWRRFFILPLGFLCCILGLARPQGGHYATTQRGLHGDLFIALDISNSMRAEDISPSRLGFATAFISRLLREVPGLRVAIFPFAANGYLQMPLSADQDAASDLVSSLTTSATTNQGTNFDASLTTLLTLIQKETAAVRSDHAPTRVLLLSDGETHESVGSGILEKFRARNIPIDTVGVATTQGGTIPIETRGGFGKDSLRDSNGRPVHSRLETASLRKISDVTGGNYYAARFEETGQIANRILQGMEFGKLTTSFQLETEYFPWLFLIALGIFSVEFFFGGWHYLIRSWVFFFLLFGQAAHAWDADVEQKLKQAGRNRPYTAYNEALRLSDQGNLAEAAELFQESAATTRDSDLRKKALYDLGNTLVKLQDPVQALNAYQNAYDTEANKPKTQKELNDSISKNILLAKKLKTKQKQEQKDQKEGDGEGDQPQEPRDPGKSKQFKGQSFDESQKKKMFDMIKAEEQQVLQRMQDKNRQSPDPKGKQW